MTNDQANKKDRIDEDLEEVEEKPSDAEALKGKEEEDIENLKSQVSEFEDKWKRALADYQNLERRTTEVRKEWISESNRDLILKLLPVLDTLFLASDHLKDEGLRLSIQKFLDVLEEEGVKLIETKDKKFDPNLMEGLEIVEGPKDKVVEEIRSGFMLNDKVLRPAQVKVGSAKQNKEDK